MPSSRMLVIAVVLAGVGAAACSPCGDLAEGQGRCLEDGTVLEACTDGEVKREDCAHGCTLVDDGGASGPRDGAIGDAECFACEGLLGDESRCVDDTTLEECNGGEPERTTCEEGNVCENEGGDGQYAACSE